MKIRNGFVSNSSSSSYIIAYGAEKCPHCGRSDADLILSAVDTLGRNSDGDDTYVIADKVDLIVERLQERLSWYDDDDPGKIRMLAEFTEVSAKMAECIKDGYKLAMINVSYHDEKIRDMLRHSDAIIIREFD